ncbi:MAG: DUF5668 domain-containing protein [Pseudomonadota bacterium]
MKNEPNSAARGVPGQVIIGIAVITLGLLFLLDNLNLIEFREVKRYWPVLLIIIGVAKLMDAQTPQERMPFIILTGVGAVMTLNRLGFDLFTVRNLWPLALILVGGAVVYKALIGRRQISGMVKPEEGSDSTVSATVVLGGFDRRISVPAFRGGEITVFMGGCALDLRGSSIENEAVITVFAAMGGITLKVPPDWTIVMHGTPIMGGFDEKTITPPDNSKRLIIKGYVIMGGVEVRN